MVWAILILIVVAGTAGWRLLVDAIHREAVRSLALAPGLRVADVGSGPGRLAVRIAREVGPRGEVVGIDIDAKAVRSAERRAKRAGLAHVRFIHAAAGDGRLGENRFDRAAAVAVLGEIRNRDAAVGEIFRALKPGGLLAVTEVALDPHRQSVDGVRRLCAAAGFVEQAVEKGWLAVTITFRTPF